MTKKMYVVKLCDMMPQSYYITVHNVSKQDYFDVLLCSNFVNSGHNITKFYVIRFFGHEVTNFNPPQNQTFLEKKLN